MVRTVGIMRGCTNMIIKTSHICITDFEATCDNVKPKPGEPSLIMEIIEIGSVMVDISSLEPVSEFQSFIKPCHSKELTPFCMGLTSIKQADVDGAPGFPTALDSWAKWADTITTRGEILFSSWGLYDYKQLLKDCTCHGVAFPWRRDHMNLKEYIGTKMGWSKRGCGMGKAINRLGMKFDGVHHRGIDDAKMAAKILARVGYKPSEMGDSYRATTHDVMRVYGNKHGGVS